MHRYRVGADHLGISVTSTSCWNPPAPYHVCVCCPSMPPIARVPTVRWRSASQTTCMLVSQNVAAKGGSNTRLPHSNQPPAQHKTPKSLFQTSTVIGCGTSGPTPETQPRQSCHQGAARAGAPASAETRKPLVPALANAAAGTRSVQPSRSIKTRTERQRRPTKLATRLVQPGGGPPLAAPRTGTAERGLSGRKWPASQSLELRPHNNHQALKVNVHTEVARAQKQKCSGTRAQVCALYTYLDICVRSTELAISTLQQNPQ